MSTLPAEGDVTLLLADDVRREEGNKLAISGWYVGDNIVFDRTGVGPGQVVGIHQLALVFIVKSGEGDFKNTIRLLTPSGAVLIDQTGNVFHKNADESGVSVFMFAPFAAPEIGSYRVEWTLDDHKTYLRNFNVL